MKTKFEQVHFNLLILLFLLAINAELVAQESEVSEFKNFIITIEQTQNGVKLQCKKGCARKDLSFSTNKEKHQAINEFGMAELDKNSSDRDPDLANFLFTLNKTEQGITLKGIEGTAWTDLSFYSSIRKKQTIDRFGMTGLN